MKEPSAITTVDDEYLCNTIKNVKQRLIFMTPGMSNEVADAICSKWDELGTSAVKIIIDVDPEVCRLGYGTIDAVKKLLMYANSHDAKVYEQLGVRIALLIADDSTIFYAPTPLLIESGADPEKQHPNAVKIDLVPPGVATDIGYKPGEEGRVGQKPISPEMIQNTTNDLVRNPPQKFDIARKVRVFNARIEFVEFELQGHMIARKKVTIPSDLLGLAKDEKTQKLLHSSFQLIDEEDTNISGDEIAKKKEKILKDYLTNLPNFGNVILRSKKDAFEKEIAVLRKDIESFQKNLKEKLQTAINKNRQALITALAPAVAANPPKRWKKFLPDKPNENDVKEILNNELEETFGSAEDNLKKIELSVIFKGVTYETLNNPKFVDIVRKKIPINDLFEEYDAAKEASEKADKKY